MDLHRITSGERTVRIYFIAAGLKTGSILQLFVESRSEVIPVAPGNFCSVGFNSRLSFVLLVPCALGFLLYLLRQNKILLDLTKASPFV